jgi:hypothetical protein
MASFPLSDIAKVAAHPAKGMSWSKGAIIVKRIPFPKGAVPPHLVRYTERFASAAKECARRTAGARGAERVKAMNACVAGALRGGR